MTGWFTLHSRLSTRGARRTGPQRKRATVDRLVQYLAQPGELGIGQEPLAGRSWYFSIARQGLQPSSAKPQPAPSRCMCDRTLTHLFAVTGRSGQLPVDIDNVAPLARFERQPA